MIESRSIFRSWAFRFVRWRWVNYLEPLDHDAVLTHVLEDGGFSPRYAFMATMSCAIAILGLLLSSPAVVIGAMLISPLMGPIISLGFSLCVLDSDQMKKALKGLAAGIVIAVGISFLIVKLSPLSDATAEIMSRTRPNFLDLLVALFSGLAGGYAVIKRKGETIVGVAIATALMPPLAVVGFGLATASAPIAQGAFMLFMTNLLAIALTVTALAKWYGFGIGQNRKHSFWQVGLIIVTFAALSLPLGHALRDITYQTYVTKNTRGAIQEYISKNEGRISTFNISFPASGDINIDTVVLTPRYDSKAPVKLRDQLKTLTGKTVKLSLEQVVLARETIKEIPATPQPESNALTPAAPVQSPAASGSPVADFLKQQGLTPEPAPKGAKPAGNTR